jgi:hypothetical protein
MFAIDFVMRMSENEVSVIAFDFAIKFGGA